MMSVRKNLAEKKEHDPRCANIMSVRKKKLAEKKEHDPEREGRRSLGGTSSPHSSLTLSYRFVMQKLNCCNSTAVRFIVNAFSSS
jgi:hypothetical protein